MNGVKNKKDLIIPINAYIQKGGPKGALLINGAWGSGKTYFIQNQKGLKGAFQLSLFGQPNITDIQKALIECIESKNKKGGITELTELSQKFMDIPVHNETSVSFSTLNKIIEDLLPERSVIIFDDLERTSPNVDGNSLAGFVSFLTQKSHSVILVSDFEKINTNLINHFEKVIEKEYAYNPTIEDILSSILEDLFRTKGSNHRIEDNPFYQSVKSNIDLLKTDIDDYKPKFSNLRSLIYALNIAYTLLDGKKFSDFKFRNVWNFIHAVSIEYKAGNLNFFDDNGLNEFYSDKDSKFVINDYLNDEDDSFVQTEEEGKREKKREQLFDKKKEFCDTFKSVFYEPYNITPYYFFHLYQYICGGNVSEDSVIEEISLVLDKYDTKREFILLDKFESGSFLNQSNEECKKDLKDLKDYTFGNKYQNTSSFIKACEYLDKYGIAIEYTKEEFEKQLNNFIENLHDKKDLSLFNLQQLEVNEQDSQSTRKIKNILKTHLQPQVLVQNYDQANEDFKNFQEFCHKMKGGSLYHIKALSNNPELLSNKLKTIEPWEVNCLEDYLRRYSPSSMISEFETEERVAVKNICRTITNIDEKDCNTVGGILLTERVKIRCQKILEKIYEIERKDKALREELERRKNSDHSTSTN